MTFLASSQCDLEADSRVETAAGGVMPPDCIEPGRIIRRWRSEANVSCLNSPRHHAGVVFWIHGVQPMQRISTGLKTLMVSTVVVASAAFIDPAQAFDGFVNYTPEFGGRVACSGTASVACFRLDLSSAVNDDMVMTRQWMDRGEVISGIVTGSPEGSSELLLTGHGENWQAPIIYARYGAAASELDHDCAAPLTDGCAMPLIEGEQIHYSIKVRVVGTELVHFYALGL
ncbi:hypothetical protein [Stenotrophomonas maltophilia]|uniref:hypothetical protein n=2 Tax=Gammaproteobacteria TaxID=1236 RepID=UPI0013D8ECD3|nr:hypothetical protein [Stenotrophomonas maltophilia]